LFGAISICFDRPNTSVNLTNTVIPVLLSCPIKSYDKFLFRFIFIFPRVGGVVVFGDIFVAFGDICTIRFI